MSGVTHALGVKEVGNNVWTTLREINANGYNVYETAFGDYVMVLKPWSNTTTGEKFEGEIMPVEGFFTKEDGQTYQKGIEQNAKLLGKVVMRNLQADEKVVKLAA